MRQGLGKKPDVREAAGFSNSARKERSMADIVHGSSVINDSLIRAPYAYLWGSAL